MQPVPVTLKLSCTASSPSANFSPTEEQKDILESLQSYPGNCIQVTVGVARLLGFLMISLQSVGCVLHRRRTAAAPSLPPTRLTLGPHHHNHQHHHQEHQHQHQTHHHNHHQHHHQEHQHQTHQQHLDHYHHYHHQHSHYQQQIIGNLTCGYLYTV